MKKVFYRIVGVLLILAAIGGLVFSLVSMYVIWSIRTPMAQGISSGVALLTQTLEATSEGLLVTQQALKTSVDSIRALESTLNATATAIDSTEPLLGTVSEILTEDMPNTIASTQSALEGVMASAKIIDSVLKALTVFNRDAYNPEKPMHESLSDVSQTLENLPKAMRSIEASMTDTKDSLGTIQNELALMANNVGEIQTSVENFSNVIDQYLTLVNDLILQLDALESNLPTYVNWLAIGIIVFLIWMAIAQLGLLTQGWELLHRNGAEEVTSPEEIQDAPQD